jgi:choline dehydrogenase-like flavoprotein
MKRAIVVGSGAGGAMAARELQRSFDVTVLEEGHEFQPFRRDVPKLERLRATGLFLDERMIRALFPAMRVMKARDGLVLVRGSSTGGTTTLATANALRCDDALREIGVDLDAEFDALLAELPISTDHARGWRPVTRRLFAACEDLRLEPQVMPKLVDLSKCRRCGRCVLGCAHGAKWDSRRLLREAREAGATVVTGARVERVAVEHRGGPGRGTARATGVVVRRRGRTRHLSADLVVLSAGGLGTPAILDASGIATERHLFVDPVLCVAAPWPDEELPPEMPMPFAVDRGELIVSPYFDYLSFFFNPAWRSSSRHILSLMVKFADSEDGGVERRRVSKGVTPADRRRISEGVDVCRQILGRLGVPAGDTFLGTLNAGHPGGTLPLTPQSAVGLRDERLPANLYVSDASLLPRSLGKPPMLTIMALAKRVAAACKETAA